MEQRVAVPGPQLHEDIAEISGSVTSSGGPLRKSARLPRNGPEVFEFESGSGSLLQQLPFRLRRRRHRIFGVEAKGEVTISEENDYRTSLCGREKCFSN